MGETSCQPIVVLGQIGIAWNLAVPKNTANIFKKHFIRLVNKKQEMQEFKVTVTHIHTSSQIIKQAA